MLTSLRQFVDAITVEEDCDDFRKYLLQEIRRQQFELTSTSIANIAACDPMQMRVNDMHLIIGLLKWALLSGSQRPTVNYPTRSLRVWSVAAV